MSGEVVREKGKGPSTGVYCLQLVLIRTEQTGIRGSYIQVQEGINLTQRKGFILKTFRFLLFSLLFICDQNFTLQRTSSFFSNRFLQQSCQPVSFCCDSLWNMLLAHWHKEKKEVLANQWQMKRWQLARGSVQGQSDLLDG